MGEVSEVGVVEILRQLKHINPTEYRGPGFHRCFFCRRRFEYDEWGYVPAHTDDCIYVRAQQLAKVARIE